MTIIEIDTMMVTNVGIPDRSVEKADSPIIRMHVKRKCLRVGMFAPHAFSRNKRTGVVDFLALCKWLASYIY